MAGSAFLPKIDRLGHLARRVRPGDLPAASRGVVRRQDDLQDLAPVFAGLERTLAPLRWLQQGRVQLYVLYIAFTLLVLLVWKLGEA